MPTTTRGESTSYMDLTSRVASVWMFALGGLTLHLVECQYTRILILRLNANIFVWMFIYSDLRLDIEVECQMLFRQSK
jgi:hypothetical protein